MLGGPREKHSISVIEGRRYASSVGLNGGQPDRLVPDQGALIGNRTGFSPHACGMFGKVYGVQFLPRRKSSFFFTADVTHAVSHLGKHSSRSHIVRGTHVRAVRISPLH